MPSTTAGGFLFWFGWLLLNGYFLEREIKEWGNE
jgi:hypothetical protein